jgi:putative IMPACT (imprinted ancient) family translation regulator
MNHVKALRKKYYDATHVCFAYRLGADGEVFRAYDDREPSGTAGLPILGQLRSHELTNVLVAVVRYFGGTKLGTPGLIKAYREAAKSVIEGGELKVQS